MDSAKEFHAHMREHKAYKCDECGKNYATKENLTRHKADVHEKMTVSCYPCQDYKIKRVSKSTHQLGKKHLLKSQKYFSDCLLFLYTLTISSKAERKNLSKFLGKWVFYILIEYFPFEIKFYCFILFFFMSFPKKKFYFLFNCFN